MSWVDRFAHVMISVHVIDVEGAKHVSLCIYNFKASDDRC